jgi:hypothetical protein
MEMRKLLTSYRYHACLAKVNTQVFHGEGGKSPSPLPVLEKTDQKGLTQKIKTKNPKFMSICEMRAYTLHCNVALPQAAYPFQSQSG